MYQRKPANPNSWASPPKQTWSNRPGPMDDGWESIHNLWTLYSLGVPKCIMTIGTRGVGKKLLGLE